MPVVEADGRLVAIVDVLKLTYATLEQVSRPCISEGAPPVNSSQLDEHDEPRSWGHEFRNWGSHVGTILRFHWWWGNRIYGFRSTRRFTEQSTRLDPRHFSTATISQIGPTSKRLGFRSHNVVLESFSQKLIEQKTRPLPYGCEDDFFPGRSLHPTPFSPLLVYLSSVLSSPREETFRPPPLRVSYSMVALACLFSDGLQRSHRCSHVQDPSPRQQHSPVLPPQHCRRVNIEAVDIRVHGTPSIPCPCHASESCLERRNDLSDVTTSRLTLQLTPG